jgi:VWFA-related protein
MSKPQILCLSLLLCLRVFVCAQQPATATGAAAQSEPASAPVAENGEGRIKLDVVVTDKPGKPVSGLAVKDFTLLDNYQPGKILSFHAVDGTVQPADPPVEVILVLDTVNVPYVDVAIARQEIAKFLLQNGGHLAQPVSIQMFTNQGLDFQSDPSTDGNALAAQVNQLDNRLRTLGRSAAGNGASDRFKLSIQAMGALAGNEAKKPGRKLLIWAGEGWPMLEVPNFQVTSKAQQQYFDAIVLMSTLLREARISVYSISQSGYRMDSYRYEDFLKGVKSTNDAGAPNLALKVLAMQSGGRVLGPDNNLAGQINTCVQDASAFYTLTFDPPHANKPNEYHDLKVQIGKPGLKAHTSTGYYNQP